MAVSADRALKIIISGDAKGALAAFKETEGGSEGLKGKLGSLSSSGALVGVGIAAGAVAAGAALFKIGSDFQEQYNKISVATGATGKSLDGLKDSFKAVLSDVPDSFAKVGDSITGVAQKLGLTGKPLEEMSKQFLDVSRITGTDLTTNMGSAVQALQNFGEQAKFRSGDLEFMFKASQASGLSFADLSQQLADNGAVLRSYGMDLQGSLPLLAALAKGGVNVTDVMPALAKGLATAAKSGVDANTFLTQAFDTIKKAPTATAAAGIALHDFGARAGPKLAELIRQGKFSIEEMQGAIFNSSGTIGSAAKKVETFGEKWDIIKNRVLVGLEPVATGVFNGMGKAMDKLAPILSDQIMPAFGLLAGFIDRYKPEFEVLAVVIGTTLTAAFVAWGVSATVSAAAAVAGFVATQAQAAISAAGAVVSFGMMIAGYVAEGIAATAAGIAMAAAWVMGLGPIALVIAAVAGAAVLIATHWDTIKNAAKAVWDWISTNWPLILEILTGPIGLAVRAISQHWDTIKSGFTAVKTWIGDRLSDIVGFFKGMPGRISSVASGMWDGIKNAFKSAINWIIGKWNGLHFTIPSVGFGPFHTPSFELGMPHVPQLAAGGIVQAQMGGGFYNIGEGGSNEAVIPLSASGLAPLVDAVRAGIGSTQANVVYLTVNMDGALITEGVDHLTQVMIPKLRHELEQVLRRNGPANFAVGF